LFCLAEALPPPFEGLLAQHRTPVALLWQNSDFKRQRADAQVLLIGPQVFGEPLSSFKDFKKLVATDAITILVLDLNVQKTSVQHLTCQYYRVLHAVRSKSVPDVPIGAPLSRVESPLMI
jgi:hypothetical protein